MERMDRKEVEEENCVSRGKSLCEGSKAGQTEVPSKKGRKVQGTGAGWARRKVAGDGAEEVDRQGQMTQSLMMKKSTPYRNSTVEGLKK